MRSGIAGKEDQAATGQEEEAEEPNAAVQAVMELLVSIEAQVQAYHGARAALAAGFRRLQKPAAAREANHTRTRQSVGHVESVSDVLAKSQ